MWLFTVSSSLADSGVMLTYQFMKRTGSPCRLSTNRSFPTCKQAERYFESPEGIKEALLLATAECRSAFLEIDKFSTFSRTESVCGPNINDVKRIVRNGKRFLLRYYSEGQH